MKLNFEFSPRYSALVLLGLSILFLRVTIGDSIFSDMALKIVSVVCVLVVKKIINMTASQVIFLNRKSNILALNNFRAFNIFLYFNFYFDCFMGLVSAVIRLVQSIAASLFMMPSKYVSLFVP